MSRDDASCDSPPWKRLGLITFWQRAEIDG